MNDNNNMNLNDVEVNTNQTLNTQEVDELDTDTVYVARIEFISIGDSPEVRPNFFYSHNFPDEYAGEFPSAFMALQDMGMLLKAMLHTPGSGMTAVDSGGDVPAITSIDELEASNATKN